MSFLFDTLTQEQPKKKRARRAEEPKPPAPALPSLPAGAAILGLLGAALVDLSPNVTQVARDINAEVGRDVCIPFEGDVGQIGSIVDARLR